MKIQWFWAFLILALLSAAACPATLAADKTERSTEADELVRRALLMETAGRLDERQRLLQQAVDLAPNHPPARWQLGYVQVGDEWQTVTEAESEAAKDPVLKEYKELRDRAQQSQFNELALARWCSRNKLGDRESFHYGGILNRPDTPMKVRKEAIRRLHLRPFNGSLMTDDQIRYQQQFINALTAAMKRWRPKLDQWRGQIEGERLQTRQTALKQMKAVDDFRAIPAIETYAGTASGPFGWALVEMLGGMEGAEASDTLARYALVNRNQVVRSAAAQQLEKRPFHEFVPLMLSALTNPVVSRFQVTRNASGAIVYRHVLQQDDGAANNVLNLETLWTPRSMLAARAGSNSGTSTLRTAFWMAVQRERELSRANAAAARQNQVVYDALQQATNVFVDKRPAAWRKWWTDYNDAFIEKGVRVAFQRDRREYGNLVQISTPGDGDQGDSGDQGSGGGQFWNRGFGFSRAQGMECFAAGTLVRTESGLRPIDQIRAGDRVLSRDIASGELTYRVVLQRSVRPSTKLWRLAVGGEEILATSGHPVWVVNKGWRFVRELERGQQLSGIQSPSTVARAEETDTAAPAYNLVVAQAGNYFVGSIGVLVQDNGMRRGTRIKTPGLQATSLIDAKR